MNWLTKHMLLPFFYLVRAWRYQQVVSRGQQCVGGVLFSKQLQVGGLVKRQDLGEWEQQAQLNLGNVSLILEYALWSMTHGDKQQ